jgi:hypothetical protein
MFYCITAKILRAEQIVLCMEITHSTVQKRVIDLEREMIDGSTIRQIDVSLMK